jgi:translation initiation factor IF-1
MNGRACQRISVDREIRCQIGNLSEWVVLYDLSASGAMIEVGKINIEVGDEIQLKLHDIISATGQIAWKIDGNAGVKFNGILNASILEYFGSSSSVLAFEEQQPRDRFGEILSSLDSRLSKSPIEGQPKVDTLDIDWLDNAELQVDRRRIDRGDSHRRREERLALNSNAKLCKSIREGCEGRLVDLSTTGCSFLDTSNSFQPGDQVWLKMEALELWRGTVRWVKDEKVGIEFDRPFYPAVLNHLVALHRGVVVSRAA